MGSYYYSLDFFIALIGLLAPVSLWALLFCINAAHVGLTVFYFLVYMDYEDDTGYSSEEIARRLNWMFQMEYLTQGLCCFILLLGATNTQGWHLHVFLFNLPLLLYHVYLFHTGNYLINPAALWKTVSKLKDIAVVKLFVYCFLLTLTTICMVLTFVEIGHKWK